MFKSIDDDQRRIQASYEPSLDALRFGEKSKSRRPALFERRGCFELALPTRSSEIQLLWKKSSVRFHLRICLIRIRR